MDDSFVHRNPFEILPLTPAAEKMRDRILAISRTDEPFIDDIPEGLDLDGINDLHRLASSGARDAIPQLRRALMKFPDYPVLRNYLRAAHTLRGEQRSADAVLKDMSKFHPDYLFTRIGVADRALDKENVERAVVQVGEALDIRSLYPGREVFHVSELRNYYLTVAKILARTGRQDEALGVRKALEVIDHDPNVSMIIEREVMLANMASMKQRVMEDNMRRVTVKTPKPDKTIHVTERQAFRHEVMGELYEIATDFEEGMLDEMLALPRDSFVADLCAVLDDCVARTPHFMHGKYVPELDFAAFHALHLLAEVRGVEGCPHLLKFLSMPPAAVDFWLGDWRGYISQIARIIEGDLPACMEWLKSPGIDSRAKGMVVEAMEQVAKSAPARLGEIASGLGEVLEYVITSPKDENILDTGFIFLLISALTELRAVDELPVIRRAYEMDLVELFKCGNLMEIEGDMVLPMNPPKPWRPMLEQYEKYGSEDDPDEEDTPIDPIGGLLPDKPFPAFSTPPPPGLAAGGNNHPVEREVGRNDPCPCGSGKKFKKCCMG